MLDAAEERHSSGGSMSGRERAGRGGREGVIRPQTFVDGDSGSVLSSILVLVVVVVAARGVVVLQSDPPPLPRPTSTDPGYSIFLPLLPLPTLRPGRGDVCLLVTSSLSRRSTLDVSTSLSPFHRRTMTPPSPHSHGTEPDPEHGEWDGTSRRWLGSLNRHQTAVVTRWKGKFTQRRPSISSSCCCPSSSSPFAPPSISSLPRMTRASPSSPTTERSARSTTL